VTAGEGGLPLPFAVSAALLLLEFKNSLIVAMK